MTGRPVLEPSASYPITINPTGRHVTVRVGGAVVAETDSALTLREPDHPAVQYIPLADVDQRMLQRTATASYCPFKGDAGYYRVAAGGEDAGGQDAGGEDIAWEYAEPFTAVAAIAGHVAFYPDRAEISIG